MLLTWQIESDGQARLSAVVEFQLTETDRDVRTFAVRASEPFDGELPGDLAAASGRLLRRLVSEGLTIAGRAR
jgi:hypothetical protein